MRLRFFCAVIFFSFASISACAKEPGWFTKLKEIRIFQSTKADVERIFGYPTVNKSFIDGGIEVVNYETSDGKLHVVFSSGNCERPYDYRIAKGSVTSARFRTEKLTKISDFGFNKVDFETRNDDAGWVYYFNRQLGFEYETYRGMVGAVELMPTLENESLKCENQTK
jgi:hypothetical protein